MSVVGIQTIRNEFFSAISLRLSVGAITPSPIPYRGCRSLGGKRQEKLPLSKRQRPGFGGKSMKMEMMQRDPLR